MARFFLGLAFIVSAVGILQNKLWELAGVTPILFLDLALMLPAVVLGSIYWWKGRSYASCWPVVLCIALVWISLLFPGNVERSRGLLIAALVTIPLPLAALMVEKRMWTFCAKIYVWANAVAMAAAIWFESRVENSFLSLVGRFGFLVSADGSSHTGNPNQVGGQFAFASVVAFILYLKSSESAEEGRSESRSPDVYLILMVLLSIGCMMTASRGAFVAWFPAIGILFVLGTRHLPATRHRDLVALSAMGVLAVFSLVAADRAAPWEKLAERFGDKQEIGSFSNRSDVWLGAVKAWQSKPDYVWRGTGIGMADDVLGEFSPNPEEDDQGVLRKNCHNAAIEWVLSLGVLGIVAGCCLAGSMVYQMFRLDGRDGNVGRTAMIICVLVFAMTAVNYRHKSWPATGALVLAMLTEPALRRREDPSENDESASPLLAGHHYQMASQLSRCRSVDRPDADPSITGVLSVSPSRGQENGPDPPSRVW